MIEEEKIVKDPFDEPLEPPESVERLILNDTYFAAARNAITVDGMAYSFLKPPYMNFEDQIRAKQKLKEAYTQQEFLLRKRSIITHQGQKKKHLGQEVQKIR